jgi:hypothetical protein
MADDETKSKNKRPIFSNDLNIVSITSISIIVYGQIKN